MRNPLRPQAPGYHGDGPRGWRLRGTRAHRISACAILVAAAVARLSAVARLCSARDRIGSLLRSPSGSARPGTPSARCSPEAASNLPHDPARNHGKLVERSRSPIFCYGCEKSILAGSSSVRWILSKLSRCHQQHRCSHTCSSSKLYLGSFPSQLADRGAGRVFK
jgi:hypothetical protein